MNNIYYVYEHIRNDNGLIFYGGKGKENRAMSKKDRNNYWNNVVNKCNGFSVNILIKDIDEEFALFAEKEIIDLYRKININLTNITDGGDGVSGLKHSDKTKEILREKRAKQTIIITEETKRKIGLANSISLKGKKNSEHSARMKGRKQSTETINKRIVSMLGHKVSDETKEKIRLSNIGKKRTDEAKDNMSKSHFGKKLSEEHKQAMKLAQLKRWAKIKEAK